jgi:hypothetical protein
MRPSMTRECDERMWNLAYRLAQSGEHQNYQAIEWELRAFGYPRAPQLLCYERVREKLDGNVRRSAETELRCRQTRLRQPPGRRRDRTIKLHEAAAATLGRPQRSWQHR